MQVNSHRRDWRHRALLILSVLSAAIIVNASLVIGWGGLSYFSSRYRILLSALFSLEVLLSRLLENTDTGLRTVERQAWVALFAPFCIGFNILSAWTLHRAGAIPVDSAAIGVAWFSFGLGFRAWSARTL